jgi:hypothetical protein
MDALSEFLNNHSSLIKWLVMLTIGSAGIMFLILWLKEGYKEEIEPFKKLFTFLNGKFTSNILSQFFSCTFKGVHEGFPYTIKLRTSGGGGEEAAKLNIFFERHTPFTMSVFPKGGVPLANIGSLHWYPQKVKTGNLDFDNRFVVYSDDVLPVSSYVKTPDVQEHISTLFLLGYQELNIAKNKVRAEKYIGDEGLAIDFDKTRLTKTIESLSFLTKSLP